MERPFSDPRSDTESARGWRLSDRVFTATAAIAPSKAETTPESLRRSPRHGLLGSRIAEGLTFKRSPQPERVKSPGWRVVLLLRVAEPGHGCVASASEVGGKIAERTMLAHRI